MKRGYIGDSDLLGAGTLFLIGSVIAAIFNYTYHLLMGRMLGPSDYGILASLFAIIYFALFSNNVFNTIISKYSAEFHSKNQFGYFKSLILRGLKKILIYGSCLLAVYFLLVPYIASFLNLESVYGLVIVGFTVYVSLMSTVILGSLNGMQKFGWQNIANVASVVLKLLFALLFVYLGLGVNGALIAIGLGMLASLIIGLYPLARELKGVQQEYFDSSRVYSYMVPVFFSSLLSMSLITADQIMVKHYFSSVDSGNYAAAGVIAKAVWFISVFFVPALFPKVVSNISKNKETSQLLRKTISYTSAIVAFGTLAYYLFPEFIVSMLYGKEYTGISSIIWIFGLSMGFFSLIQVFTAYNLAHERRFFILFLLLGVIFEILGIAMFHEHLTNVIFVFFAANFMTLLCLFLYNRKELFEYA